MYVCSLLIVERSELSAELQVGRRLHHRNVSSVAWSAGQEQLRFQWPISENSSTSNKKQRIVSRNFCFLRSFSKYSNEFVLYYPWGYVKLTRYALRDGSLRYTWPLKYTEVFRDSWLLSECSYDVDLLWSSWYILFEAIIIVTFDFYSPLFYYCLDIVLIIVRTLMIGTFGFIERKSRKVNSTIKYDQREG